jgi:hypothetical protein
LAIGRRLLFLARTAAEEPRDVWRARAHLSPDGRVLDVAGAHDLANTPLGDDHALVVRGARAAFATRAYGQEQSVTLLNLDGEGAQNKTTELADRAMAAVTNLQRTGSFAGLGRLEVTFESPGRAVGLALSDDALKIELLPSDPRRSAAVIAQLDLARGDLSPPVEDVHVEASIHLPKRFAHWCVDTLRAVPWIGPVPIAWMEDQALALRDTVRRLSFSSSGSTDVVAETEPAVPVLDTSEASVEEAHWPPPPIASIWKSAEHGEGEWVVPALPWLRRVPAAAPDAPSPFYETFVRPDEERPYAKVLLVAMDMRQLDLDMEAGVEDPEPLTGPPGAGRIPRDPAVYRRVAAAFNGAFKTEHGHYGMMVHKRVLLPPVPGAATVVVLDDGRAGFGTWGSDRRVGGVLGVADDQIASFRQNLDPLVEGGRINPAGRNLWGFTLPGKGVQTERTGLCVTKSGHLLYAWGDDVSATTLGKSLAMAGCDYGMHLDMNPYHTGFLFTAIDDLTAKKYKSSLLSSAMSIPTDRYIQYAPKDFFYVLVHDPTPPPLRAGSAWAVDGGLQPPPRWLPGLWSARFDAERPVDLISVEAGRASFRLRAGARDASAANPLREIAGDEAKRVLLAVGMGTAPDRRPLGLATDGRLTVVLRGTPDLGVLTVSGDGQIDIARADDAPPLAAHGDAAELPMLLWDGKRVGPTPTPGEAEGLRGAIGITPEGRVVVARASVTTADPLAAALAAAGCSRALLLDRGLHATGRIDRAGTDHPPHARYEETVLYAVGLPLRPRGFHFEASTLIAQAPRTR